MENMKNAFLSPANEYGAIPFWFLNDELSFEELERQMRLYAQAGIGGFVLHPRIGVTRDIEFMSARFLDRIEFAVKLARELGLKIMLYDEASYPSGSAHGLVTASNPDYASVGLKVVEIQKGSYDAERFSAEHLPRGSHIVGAVAGIKREDGSLDPQSLRYVSTRPYAVAFSGEESFGGETVFVFIQGFCGGVIRGLHDGEDNFEPGSPLSASILNEQAVRAFIRFGYDPYYARLKDYFGDPIIAMFTDEPDPLGKSNRKWRAWAHNFLEDYFAAGCSLLDLPALFYDIGPATQDIRDRYESAVYQRMSACYYTPLSQWCAARGIALTGHPRHSDEIGCLDFFQIPGQDMVWKAVLPFHENALSGRDSTQAKCAADAARHRGLGRNLNECFGAYGDELSAQDMRWLLNWMFMRGTNLIVPHALSYSSRGIRGEDRPPDLGIKGKHWHKLEPLLPYIRRMSYLLSDTKSVARVAVLCGIHRLDSHIQKLLHEHQIDFTFLETALLEEGRAHAENGLLTICGQAYTHLILPGDLDFTPERNGILASFLAQGGVLLRPTDDERLLAALSGSLRQPYRVQDGACSLRVSAFTRDGRLFILFANEGQETIPLKATVPGASALHLWNADTGEVSPYPHCTPCEDGLYIEDSLPVLGMLVLSVE